MSIKSKLIKKIYLPLLYNVKRWIRRKVYLNKIDIISHKNPFLFIISEDTCELYTKYWEGKGFKNIDKRWYLFYKNCSGIDDLRYIPEDIYYMYIEPKMNNPYTSIAYKDKNSYEQRYDSSLFPNTFIRCINGIFYDHSYNQISDQEIYKILITRNKNECIIKPAIESGSGKSIQFAKIYNGKIYDEKKNQLSILHLRAYYEGNLLIQDIITQHVFFAQFNPESFNTIRIYTYYSEYSKDAYVLKAIMKMGRAGSCVDNINAGAISCGLDINGSMNTYAVDKYGFKYYEHPDSLISFEGKIVPNCHKMYQIAKDIQKKNLHNRLLGFDIGMDSLGNILVVEINYMDLGINSLQLFGGSLFGDFTEEIINIYSENNFTRKHNLRGVF